LSYSNSLRWQESNLRPSDPDVTLAFTTPQTLPSLSSLFRYLSIPRRRTRVAHTQWLSILRSESEPLNIPGGIGAHGLSGFEPEPFGLASEVTVNFTIPGSCFFAKYFDDKKIYAVPVA
jgi:hypothetical protein